MTRTQLLLIGGRSGAGKSTVASHVFDLLAASDVRHARIEGDFLDLAYPSPWEQGLQLAEQNLQAVWRNYARNGYHRLVYSNTACVLPGPSKSVIAALGGDVEVAAVLLRASDGIVEDRLATREDGASLTSHVGRSSAMAALLDAEAPAEVTRIDTDGRPPADVATEIIAMLRWNQ